ncbi:bacitracin ABC transporter ATP-binding protein [Clostridium tetani]|uniref:ABC transporter ATP-binding protein n=1 Tax=Clostridium tetani TaxID=1513 RepID=UPI000D1FF301|nr:ABC transporter ATP-binding protein [Clostridium tetani]AVP55678.1 bacitracin ABC transporter ATP-binding protein [Clostridium tetani]RXM72774.1 ABC transporter ATP-binding protein [Clostridium tetani]BDR71061.1 bacitracin ABC transporter ATP-binding protein [Clostridium tetani]BDR79602.1 bacitracin ABC transporter ATP-binding protein [Clostridium tetani]BDR85239.1 bacitracin ABC transporter ATP-binding protein [Clostridium tetani]
MSDTVLKVKNITKKYHNHLAVNNVSMEINQGEIYGLIGKNGAGKTTLLKMICGLTIPSIGEISLFNETSQNGLNKSRRRTGSIIETPSFFPYLSAKKNLEYYRIQKGIAEKNCVDEIIKAVNLEDAGNKKFKNFSLGMKQRLGLALALMANPDLLILDEPINGLDPTGIVEFREILLKLNKERNTTIIISSHILGELSQMATMYGFINKGELVEQISSKELQEKCKRCLSIKVKNVEKATVIIEKELKCKNYIVLNDNEIRLHEHIDTPEIVAQALVCNGVMLCSMNQIGANLESYFINLIGGVHNA